MLQHLMSSVLNDPLGQLGRKIIGRRLLNSTRPDPLHLRKIVVVGAGSFHSFAVDADGHVYAWGLNQYGQLGLEIEDETIVWTPTLVPSLSPLELGNDARVTQISGGEHHTLFLLSDGRVYAAGRFDSSQLGLAPDHPATKKMEEQNRVYISTPARVFFPPEASADRPNPELPAYKASDDDQVINPIVKISVGGRASLAVSKSGHVYSWGYGASCQVGIEGMLAVSSNLLTRWSHLLSSDSEMTLKSRQRLLECVGKAQTTGSWKMRPLEDNIASFLLVKGYISFFRLCKRVSS